MRSRPWSPSGTLSPLFLLGAHILPKPQTLNPKPLRVANPKRVPSVYCSFWATKRSVEGVRGVEHWEASFKRCSTSRFPFEALSSTRGALNRKQRSSCVTEKNIPRKIQRDLGLKMYSKTSLDSQARPSGYFIFSLIGFKRFIFKKLFFRATNSP